MNQRLTLRTAALLTVPPLLWAGNAVVGRLVQGLVPPITLNFLRWLLAFALLLPAGRLGAAARQRPVAALAALRAAGPAGRGLLQRAAIPGAEDVHAAERDAGRRPARRCGCWASARCSSASAFRTASSRARCCPSPACWWCSAAAIGNCLMRVQLVPGRPLHPAGHRRLGVLQLAVDPPRRPAGHSPDPQIRATGPPS